jgi:quercetin dioxygenase-like cupin family protein
MTEMTPDAYKHFANLNTAVEIPDDGIVSRTIFQDDYTKVVLFGFSKGHELSEHAAAVPAIMHFISGDAQVTLGEEQHKATAGAWYYMEPKLPHSIYAETPLVLLLLLLKSAKPLPIETSVA